MAGPYEITNMAMFCDFENIALGVRDAKYPALEIKKVLERLLLKGSIVVKKAYCDSDFSPLVSKLRENNKQVIGVGVKPAEPRNEEEEKCSEVLEFLVKTVDALIVERGSDEKIWGSMVKSTMQRLRPGFNESAFGYRSFKELVEDADKRKLLTMTRNEKSGQCTIWLTPSE